MSVYSLKILQDNRDALLLAEALGWLHDYRKCSEEHLQTQAPGSKTQALPRSELSKQQPNLQNISLALPTVQSSSRTITSLLDDKTWSQDTLGQFLSRCHNTAHFDKQEPVGGEQNYPGTQISSAFGFEKSVGTTLTARLWSLPWITLEDTPTSNRQDLREKISTLFAQTVADSRRPINEVDLWSWGLLVGALYKSALAGALLGYQPQANDLHWRLLGIRVNGLDYLAGAVRIPDLLARQELLTNGLDRVRDLLEVTYPLGSEVYRDENGSVFVVPNIANLLEITDEHGTSLRELILKTFSKGTVKGQPVLQVDGEILPQIELEQQPWWGQDPDWEAKTQLDKKNNLSKKSTLYGQELRNEIPGIGAFILQEIVLSSDPDWVTQFWTGNSSDICTVCGLRPQGPGKKAKDRKVCDICEERRADRSQTWVKSQPDRTIWTAEVADTNGRLALLVGQFDLTHWLDGSLVESLLVIAPDNAQNPVKKTPSFSRIRRIWETTHSFWKEVEDDTLRRLSDDRRRLKIYLTQPPDLGTYHVYDLQLGQVELDVVWVSPYDNTEDYLLTADNLNYIARRLGAEKEIYEHPATAAIWVEDYLRAQFLSSAPQNQPVLYNPDLPPGKRKSNLISGIFIRDIQYQSNQYAAAIPILAEPQIFMALVPADRGLEVVKAIKEKYEHEMGKVQNRLPLHLGVVFASRRMPLQAILEAGRAMLQRSVTSEQWTVTTNRMCVKSEAPAPLQNSAHFEQWQEVRLKNAAGREITLPVSIVMGDGKTEDVWYPYWRVEGKPTDRTRWFTGPDGEHWVHVCDLRQDDEVAFTPSTFDFEFLDSASRRFEVYYDENGRRPRRTRPFYLQDVERLENLWEEHFSLFKRSQFSQMLQTIEAARERWNIPVGDKALQNEVFCQFVEDTLANAKILSLRAERSSPPPGAEIASPPAAARNDIPTQLIEAAVRGELADWAEIHLEILKEKMKGEQP